MTNELKSLPCGTPAHSNMARLMGAKPDGIGPWSMWVCQRCGLLALHMETGGDIYWYGPPTSRSGTPHKAGCA